MFTGLVEVRGSVIELVDDPPGRRLEVDVETEWAAESSTGDSVAINGCCLSVVEIGESSLVFQAQNGLARNQAGGSWKLSVRAATVDGSSGTRA